MKSQSIKPVYILASKNKSGTYQADELVPNLEDVLYGIEYGDAINKECQIWEYPSGKIYTVQPDRKINSDKDYYSLPSKDLWLPELVEIGTDEAQVKDAFDLLASRKKSKKPLNWLLYPFKLFKR